MKSIFITFIVLLAINKIFAQDSLKYFNQHRTKITVTGMKVLGGWGIANIAAGGIGWSNAKDNIYKNFYQMNTFWGIANTGISILGFTNAKRNSDKALTANESLKEQHKIEKTFLINGGLDFAYIGTGIYLDVRGNSKDNSKLKGYGSSVIMQGIFLLLFDASMYSLQKSNGKKFNSFMRKNAITFSGNSLGVVHYF